MNNACMPPLSHGDEVTPEQSTERTRKAADQGNANAQNSLGVMYYKGQGVAQGYAECVRWCRKAADQGCADAQINLGSMYSHGEGVKRAVAPVAASARSDLGKRPALRLPISGADPPS